MNIKENVIRIDFFFFADVLAPPSEHQRRRCFQSVLLLSYARPSHIVHVTCWGVSEGGQRSFMYCSFAQELSSRSGTKNIKGEGQKCHDKRFIPSGAAVGGLVCTDLTTVGNCRSCPREGEVCRIPKDCFLFYIRLHMKILLSLLYVSETFTAKAGGVLQEHPTLPVLLTFHRILKLISLLLKAVTEVYATTSYSYCSVCITWKPAPQFCVHFLKFLYRVSPGGHNDSLRANILQL